MKQKALRPLLGVTFGWVAGPSCLPVVALPQTAIREQSRFVIFGRTLAERRSGVWGGAGSGSIQLPAANSFIVLSAPTEREDARSVGDRKRSSATPAEGTTGDQAHSP